MIRKTKGSYSAKNLKFAIVVSQFNEALTNRLLEGAVDTLLRSGAQEKNIEAIYVPGAFEIPLAVKKIISREKIDAVITLAVVIRGKTKHFDQVVKESAKGVREISMKTQVPVILGIIPAENEADALARTGIKQANKGRDWALAAIEMANLMKKI